MSTKQRSEDQRVVGVALSADLDSLMKEASLAEGETPSQFIRKAIILALQGRGYKADMSMAAPPARAGKGGRPSHKTKPAPTGAKPDPVKRKPKVA